jgi:hypothetical protein
MYKTTPLIASSLQRRNKNSTVNKSNPNLNSMNNNPMILSNAEDIILTVIDVPLTETSP